MPMNKRVVCAVDGGGTKTLAIAVNAKGKELARATTGPSNYVIGEANRVVENVTAAVINATRQANVPLPIESLWMGLAGIDRPGAREEIQTCLSHLARDVRLTNDAQLLFGALEDEVGIVLIAGTGSIALGKDPHGATARAGGWGYLIGDEGSAYDLGQMVVQTASRVADGRAEESALLPLLLDHWRLDDPMQIIPRVYGDPTSKALIADCAPLMFEAASQGDATAQTLVAYGATQLADSIIAVATRLGFQSENDDEDDISLVMAGSVLVENGDYRTLIEEWLRQQFPYRRFVIEAVVAEPALVAAQRLARSLQA